MRDGVSAIYKNCVGVKCHPDLHYIPIHHCILVGSLDFCQVVYIKTNQVHDSERMLSITTLQTTIMTLQLFSTFVMTSQQLCSEMGLDYSYIHLFHFLKIA